ncbi:MAG: ribose 5-phosphate isomerase B [Chloroflexi bacterium RBG_13_68_17]|jgi:ribose 5-phosphate isomerase B|nr:MAG: ribose 5-phosphate isomerase B [Chloroflexi bacterium RBG_13_68_17]
MRIAIGADWVGFEMKQGLAEHIRGLGHSVLDLGADSSEPNDYPDYAEKVGLAVAGGQADLGILVCGTGIGMSIAANKVKGIRAALCHDAFTAARARGHNNANVLALGAWVVSLPHARELIEIFLGSPYDAGRHEPRLAKIRQLEGS